MQKLMEPYNQFDEKDEQALHELCEKVAHNGMRILEIGCWLGHATSILAKYAQDNDGFVVCIDNFRGSPGTILPEYATTHDVRMGFVENMESLGLMRNVILYPMDSDKAFKYLSDESFDLVFIDGDHRYLSVGKDIINSLRLISSGKIISGHDYEPGISFDVSSIQRDFLNQDMHNGFHCGVIHAVNQCVGKVNLSGSRIWWAVK